jgi:hypothetical protein
MDAPVYITGPFDLDMRSDWRMVGSACFLVTEGGRLNTKVDLACARDILRSQC